MAWSWSSASWGEDEWKSGWQAGSAESPRRQHETAWQSGESPVSHSWKKESWHNHDSDAKEWKSEEEKWKEGSSAWASRAKTPEELGIPAPPKVIVIHEHHNKRQRQRPPKHVREQRKEEMRRALEALPIPPSFRPPLPAGPPPGYEESKPSVPEVCVESEDVAAQDDDSDRNELYAGLIRGLSWIDVEAGGLTPEEIPQYVEEMEESSIKALIVQWSALKDSVEDGVRKISNLVTLLQAHVKGPEAPPKLTRKRVKTEDPASSSSARKAA